MICWMKRKAILTQGKTSYYSATGAYSGFPLSFAIPFWWTAGGRQVPPFSFPDCTRAGVFPHFPPGCALPAGLAGHLHIHSLKALNQGPGEGLLSVSGVRTRKHSPFCLCGHYVSAGYSSQCVLDSLPTSIPAWGCDQRRAEDSQVWAYQEIRLSGAEQKVQR